jgi:hypothetical protein
MELPDSQPEMDKNDEKDESADSDSSGSEDEEDGSDSGMDENVERNSESDSESGSEISRDFCIHQEVCPSVADCVIYEDKLVEEKRYLRVRLKEMRAERKTLTEKRRALSIIRQTVHVESKIGELERILGWMYKAREKMSTGSRQTTEQLEFPEATVSPENRG